MLNLDLQKQLHGAGGEMTLSFKSEIAEGAFIALAGQSGSGKTTLLRILAGLEKAEGKIEVNGEVWMDRNFSLSPQKRKIGFVFQDYALFPNMTVEKNLLFVNKDRSLSDHLLKVTGLSQLKERYPGSLSGGQKQRVSLCRAMMNRPKLLLMDEPLSALDPEMRTRLQHEILTLHKEFGTTTIMVSHDPSEMYRLANRVIVLNLGKVIQDGSTKEVLLKAKGSYKFALEGELLEIVKVDVIHVAVVAIGQQLVEVVLNQHQVDELRIGQKVTISTKAFSPILTTSSSQTIL